MLLAIDTECTGPDFVHGCMPYFVSTVNDFGEIRWWSWKVDPFTRIVQVDPKDVKEIRNWIYSHGKWVFHNAKFDLKALEKIGIQLSQHFDRIHDTLISSHVLDSSEPHGLKDLSVKYLDIPDDDEQELLNATKQARAIAKKLGWRRAEEGDPMFPGLRSGFVKMDTWMPAQIAEKEDYPKDHPWHTLLSTYGIRDAERTLLLRRMHEEELNVQKLEHVYQREMQLMPVVYSMESRGITVNRHALVQELERYEREYYQRIHICEKIHRKFKRADMNLNSTKQLREFLYDCLGLPEISWTDTGPSTDRNTLTILRDDRCPTRSQSHKYLTALLESRKYSTAIRYLTGYLQNLVESVDDKVSRRIHRLFPNFNQVGTRTTRFSSSNPNAQNISKGVTVEGDDGEDVKEFRLRVVFGPAPGRIWVPMDYSNQEMRIFAYAAQDHRLIEAFERGESVHMIIARELWGDDVTKESDEYGWTKNGNFALIYGAEEETADSTYHQKGAYHKIRRQFPQIDAFLEKRVQEVSENGYVTTLGGYRLMITPGEEGWRQKCCNFFVQGSAGEMAKLAMIYCHEWLESHGYDAHITMQVHDELVFDLDYSRPKLAASIIRRLKYLMEAAAMVLGVPVPASPSVTTTNWADKTEIPLPKNCLIHTL
jgi:DNA polymerase I-like protein with 3'-5' exonuclease and polymerase domains